MKPVLLYHMTCLGVWCLWTVYSIVNTQDTVILTPASPLNTGERIQEETGAVVIVVVVGTQSQLVCDLL